MAIPFVVLEGKLDRATRIRLAIIKGTAFDKEARLIKIDDVKRQWPFLCDVGLLPCDILDLANGDSSKINDTIFKSIMRSLNSYL